MIEWCNAQKFEVKGFKNFNQNIELNFSDVRDYKFNEWCIQDDLLNKIIIYGKNASGKSNIGLALFDITTHLTDKNITPGVYDYYLNADEETEYAEFHYIFKLESGEVDYLYRKKDIKNFLYERISIDGEVLISYNYETMSGDLEGIKKLMPSLNYEFQDNSVSILRYIVNNTPSDRVMPLKQLMRFVNNMLWFRSLDENRYIGYKTESSNYTKFMQIIIFDS